MEKDISDIAARCGGHWERMSGRIGAVLHTKSWLSLLDNTHEIAGLVHIFGVIIIRGVEVSPTDLYVLSGGIGEIRTQPSGSTVSIDSPMRPGLVVLSGESPASTWHSDLSYLDTPNCYTVLQAVRVPEIGGDTMWRCTVDAVDQLSPLLRNYLINVRCEHSARRLGRRSQIASHPVLLPLANGQESLYVSPLYAERLEVSESEGKPILETLLSAVTDLRGSCRTRWQEGDIAVWDNRRTIHMVVDDYGNSERVMHRISLNQHGGQWP